MLAGAPYRRLWMLAALMAALLLGGALLTMQPAAAQEAAPCGRNDDGTPKPTVGDDGMLLDCAKGAPIGTATWNVRGDNRPPQAYQDLDDNFVHNGETTASTVWELEETTREVTRTVRDGDGNIVYNEYTDDDGNFVRTPLTVTEEITTGYRLTVWCRPGLVCNWNRQDVRVEDDAGKPALDDGGSVQPTGAFSAHTPGTPLLEEVPYEAPDANDIRRARSPLGSLRAASHRGHNLYEYAATPHLDVHDNLLFYDCQIQSDTLRGDTCIRVIREFSSTSSRTLVSVTSPGDWPQYQAPTEAQIERCGHDRACVQNLHTRAQNDFNRASERYEAEWARYQQELDNLHAATETVGGEERSVQFWACSDRDQWVESVERTDPDVPRTTAPRCYLVGG
ncbi:MAG: hypothetical protein OXH12_03335 [Chloroflexi bacterium]|nr:hypothetical protein [Chloroflexota bacterium]